MNIILDTNVLLWYISENLIILTSDALFNLYDAQIIFNNKKE